MSITTRLTGKNLLKNALAISGLSLVILGCDPQPTEKTITLEKESASPATLENPDYSIKRVAIFKDDLAYDGKRGVYEITDQRTGKKYIGISGIGISEVGSHSAGRNTVQDER